MARTKRNLLQGKRRTWKKAFLETLERGLVNLNVKNNKPGYYSIWLDIWHPLGKKRIKETRKRYDRRIVKKNVCGENE